MCNPMYGILVFLNKLRMNEWPSGHFNDMAEEFLERNLEYVHSDISAMWISDEQD